MLAAVLGLACFEAACADATAPSGTSADVTASPCPAHGAGSYRQALPTAPGPVRTTSPQDYAIVRADQNWSFLSNPSARTDAFDDGEYLRTRDANDWYVSFGGEIRETNESIGYDDWGQVPYENSYALQRYLLVVDAHLGDTFRIFFEPKSDVENGRIGGANPIQEDWLDLLGAFVQARLGRELASPAVRLGTQELSLGSDRLVSPRYGPNVQQSFTGLRAWGQAGGWRFDALAVRPDLDVDRVLENYPAGTTALWGAYAALAESADRPEFDVYYLGLYRARYRIARGTGPETRHTTGIRLARTFDARRAGLDFDDEALFQFGTFSTTPIAAWSISTETAWHFGRTPLAPRLSLKADIASGDDPASRTVGTFDPYFPSGNYFGIISTTGPGFSNFVDAHPAVSSVIGRVTVTAAWLWYWRQRATDGIYTVPGSLLRPPVGRAHFVGERPGAEVLWNIDRHAYLQGDYAIFSAGPYIHASGPSSSLLYRSLWLGYKF